MEVGAEELEGTAGGTMGGQQGGPASRDSELRLRHNEDTSSTERWEEEPGGVSPRGLRGPQGGKPGRVAELSSSRSDTDSDSSPGLRRGEGRGEREREDKRGVKGELNERRERRSKGKENTGFCLLSHTLKGHSKLCITRRQAISLCPIG